MLHLSTLSPLPFIVDHQFFTQAHSRP